MTESAQRPGNAKPAEPADTGAHATSVDVNGAQPVASHAHMQINCTLGYELAGPCDFVFLIHAAAGMGQTVVDEALTLQPEIRFRTYSDPQSGNRFLRLQAQSGAFTVTYRATVDKLIEAPDLSAPEVAVSDIPDNVLRFLMPTRYCESDHLSSAAQKLFGNLPQGHSRVTAICDWVRNNVEYRIGTSTATTTARDVFVQRTGVCRDFAHLSVTFCRALNIPARLVCGYAPFPEPPPDFHAIFEAYLGGRWMQFDPTGMAPVGHVVRVATGRDAKDVAFATIFGPARMVVINPETEVVEAPRAHVLSPDAGNAHRQTEQAL